MVTLKEYLLHILENYKNEIKNNYKDNPLSEYISTKAKTTISEAIFPQEKYSIKGSSGQGRWATVPWMGIFDKEISISAQRGYYLVYLFKSDLSGVYLSLNQGYTDFKEKYKAPDRNTNIRLVSRYWQKQLHTITENNGSLFTTENISLTSSKSNTDLPRGYELGNIYSRYYSLEDLTQLTNNQLLNDLYQMNTVFLELRTMITTAYDVCNDHIIKSNFEGSNLLNAQDKHDDLNNLNLGTEVLVSKIDFFLPKTTSKKFTHIDYNKRQQKNTSLGLHSEQLVVEAEQTRLASIPELQSKKVEHTSVELGDGAGYDIKSYRLTDNKITEHFIEVKATTGDIKTPFFMSKNEINVAKEKKDKYSIVRIFKNKDNEWSHYTINGPFSEKDKLYYEPVQYQVLPK